MRELAALGVGEDDACELLAALTTVGLVNRRRSSSTGEWLYIFKPRWGELPLYVKLVLRQRCIVISFHKEGDPDEERDDGQPEASAKGRRAPR